MKTKTLNIKFKVDQIVICTLGYNKRRKFIIKEVNEEGYICWRVDKNDGKRYHFNDQWLEAAK